MQELIEWILDYDNRNLTISRYDIDRKLIELLKKEKQMIIDTVNYGKTYHKGFDFDGAQYYNETFKND